MHQSDIERFAFLFLCGKRDREILLGKEKMTFSDLDRLTYVSDFLGFKLYNLEISWAFTEADEHLHDRWLQEFCRRVPDREIQIQLEKIIKQQYKEKGLEDPTETDIM